MRKLTALVIGSSLLLIMLASCGSGSSSGSSSVTETSSAASSESSTAEELNGGDIVGKWKLNTSEIDSYEIFGADGKVEEITDFSEYLCFKDGKVFVFGSEAQYSFDGSTLSIVADGKEVYKLGKLSGGSSDSDINGSYKDLRGQDDKDNSGNYVTYYEFDGEKTFVSFGSNPYTVDGNKLTIDYISGENTESVGFTYGIDGDTLTVTDGVTKNTFKKEG